MFGSNVCARQELAAASVTPICPTWGMRECAGHGECRSDPPVCLCNSGFSGVDCAIVLACDPQQQRLPCSGRGTCTVSESTEAATHIRKCHCAPGYSGSLCENDEWCPRDALGRHCSGVGVCWKHNCKCPSHRSGVACELSTGQRALPGPP